jgi:hypothetical protein
MSEKIKWIEICVDADVDDGTGSGARPAAAACRFKFEDISEQMGYAKGEAQKEDALAMALLMVERVGAELEWADEPWTSVSAKGGCAIAAVGPGTVDAASWSVLLSKFEAVCRLYGSDGARSEIGEPIEKARLSWFGGRDAALGSAMRM